MISQSHDHDVIIEAAYERIISSLVSTEKSLVGEYWIARSGMLIALPGFTEKVLMGGYSCQADINQAVNTSRYEMLERILSTYYFSHPINRNSGYDVFSVCDHRVIGQISANQILLGTTLTDAVGLSFHTDKSAAIQHAVYELLERHILGKIWYESFPIFELGKSIQNDFTTVHYGVSELETALPFVMSVVHSDSQSILCVGASFSTSIRAAKEKSKQEACMLAHDILSKKSVDHILNFKTKKRMLSQSDFDCYSARMSYLKNIVVKQDGLINENHEYHFDDCIKLLNLAPTDIGYCILQDSPARFVVRAIAPSLKSLLDYRNHATNEDFDPIC